MGEVQQPATEDQDAPVRDLAAPVPPLRRIPSLVSRFLSVTQIRESAPHESSAFHRLSAVYCDLRRLTVPGLKGRPIQMRFADCDVLRVPVGPGALHAERYGYGGPQVVLLHGFGTTSYLWRRVAPMLAASGRTAHALDFLGYGASDRPFDAEFGIRAQGEYVSRALVRLGISDVTLVGNDLGALIALRVAVERPELVSRLVLVSPASRTDLPGPDIRLMQQRTARYVARMVQGLFGVQPLIQILLENAVSSPSVVSPPMLGRYVAPYVGREGLNHFLALARSLQGADVEDLQLTAIRQPTLVVRGGNDRWFGDVQASQLASELPAGQPETITGVGRLVAEEASATLAACIARDDARSPMSALRP